MAIKTLQNIYQLKVTLIGSKPPIWRRLLVPSTISLSELHDVLQIAMGWEDYHLHQFVAKGQFYGLPDPDFPSHIKDEARVKLGQLLNKEKESIVYEYDFGDSWEHKIVLEKILPFDKDVDLPICVTGKRSCPPEDCGGIWGYEEFLKAIQDPSHPEHDDMLEWIGGEFDPEYFDLDEINDEINEVLKKTRF